MPPNADLSRLRHRLPADDKNDLDEDQALQRATTLKQLRGTEVAIDGIIYDLTSFKHPGGDSVLIFGGNDVTVQYKMIHPHHSGKQLEKMKIVGRVTDYKPE